MTAVLQDTFTRSDTTNDLGIADVGGAWKQYNAANFRVLGNAAVKATGTASVRYFALLTGSAIPGAFTATLNFRTSPTTNGTDLGIAVLSLDSTLTRGGQLYISLRKTSTANSVRLMRRADTSGVDTALVTNSSGGWADDTDYTVVVEVSAVDGSGNRTIDVKRGGSSIIGGAYTLTSTVLATLGNDAGISFTNNDNGSKIYDFVLDDPAGTAPEPEDTLTLPVVHRGTQGARITEEKESGLATLIPGVSVEVDMRVSSDGVVFLCHDQTIDAVAESGGTGDLSSKTAAYLDAQGLMRADEYFIAAAQFGVAYIYAQHYTGTTVSAVQPCVDVCNASPMAARIIFMTSLSSPFAPQAIREAGWQGMMGTYGSTAANWSTLEAAHELYNFKLALLPPTDSAYETHRAHLATLEAAGIETGGSTINTPTGMQHVVEDECNWILTDNLDEFLSFYTPPAPPQVFISRWTGTHEIPYMLGGVYDDGEVFPVSLEVAP